MLAPAATLALAAALMLGRDRQALMAVGLAAFMAAVPVLNPWGLALYGSATQSLSSAVTQRLLDGRSEVQGDHLLMEAAVLHDVAPGWQAELRAFRPRVALLGTTSPLARTREGQGWEVTASDPLAAVLVAPRAS